MRTNRRAMRKGVLPIVALVLVIVAGAMVAEGVYLNNFIKDMEVIKRSAREMVVVSAVNTIEFRKRALQNAVAFSFQTAAGDALAMGGFCEHDGSYCDEGCRIPSSVPTFGCVPWWKVYDSVYAPAESGPQSFTDNLKNRTAAVYDDYAQSISKGGMRYCPSDPAFGMERAGSYRMRVSTTSSPTALQNRKDIKVGEKTDTVVITESNTVFTDTFESPALELFSFAHSKFASGSDAIKSAFTDAAASMPSECKEATAGDMCENDAGSSLCEAKLGAYCTSDAAGSACDANGDGRLTANERYRCAVESNLATPMSSGDGRLVATVSTDCVKTSHSSSVSGTVTHDCSAVNAEGCGCAQRCTPSMCGCASEGSACGDCSACGVGASAGWIEHDSCAGSNTFDCGAFGADNCPSPCCSLVKSGQSASGDPIYSCTKVKCSDAGYASCPAECGCSKHTDWTFGCSGLPAGCGLSNGCCIAPYGVLKDAVCNYNYFGSANASVAVQDTESAYLAGSSWEQPRLQFLVASGNADCGVKAAENPAEPGGTCCAAAATNSADKLKGCKTA